MTADLYRATICGAAACLVVTFSSSTVAQGLPFVIEDYDEVPLPAVITPSEGRTLADLQKRAQWVIAEARQGKRMRSSFKEVVPMSVPDSAATAMEGTSRSPPDSLSGFIELLYIRRPGAAAMQLVFKAVELGNSKLVVSSVDTLQEQPFSGDQLQEAAGQTALFFGTDLLLLQLIVPDGAETTPLAPLASMVSQVVTYSSLEPTRGKEEEEDPDQEQQATSPFQDEDEDTLCGEDARAFSSHPGVGRLLPSGCTAFLVEGGMVATAGHCLRKYRELQTLNFNVPKADPSANLEPRLNTEDSYALIPKSVRCSDCISEQDLPSGSDWAVFRLATNTITGLTVTQAQQITFRIPPSLDVQGDRVFIRGVEVENVAVVGYGWDNDPPEANYAQQLAMGTLGIVTTSGTTQVRLSHSVDTESGSSGSPIVALDGSGGVSLEVIGIHNGGRCRREGDTGNSGTSFTLQPLSDALTNVVSLR